MHDPLIARAIEVCGSQHELAARMGVRQQTVSKLFKREIGISAETALAIHRATDGQVPASELRPDLWRQPDDVPVERPRIHPPFREAVSA